MKKLIFSLIILFLWLFLLVSQGADTLWAKTIENQITKKLIQSR